MMVPFVTFIKVYVAHRSKGETSRCRIQVGEVYLRDFFWLHERQESWRLIKICKDNLGGGLSRWWWFHIFFGLGCFQT